MAQFDVHRLHSGRGLVIDCQSNLHRDLPTRFVVPLIGADSPWASNVRLAPRFTIGKETLVMATHFAATIAHRDLGPVVETLAEESHRVTGAIDALVAGV